MAGIVSSGQPSSVDIAGMVTVMVTVVRPFVRQHHFLLNITVIAAYASPSNNILEGFVISF